MVDFQLPDLHPTFERVVVDTIRGLCADYPRCPLEMVGMYRSEGDNSMAHADRPGVIMLNARWFARSIQELREAARERDVIYLHRGSYPVHWHGDMEEPYHVLDHEFGHKLQEGCDWRALAQPCWEHSCVDPVHARPVSGYALCTPDEWWADTFAALRARLQCEATRLMSEFLSGAYV